MPPISSSATFTATQDDDTIIDGVILSGSTEPDGNSFTFETSQSYSLEKNEPYLVDFDVAFKPQNKVQSDGTTKKDAKLECDNMIKTAKTHIQQEENQARANLQAEIVSLVIKGVEKILSKSINNKDNADIISKIIRKG